MPDEYDLDAAQRAKGRIGRLLAAETQLAELARRQHGVVAMRQLRALGFSAGWVQRRVESRHLHRLYRGVFAVGAQRPSLRARWMAAVLACGDGALLSHRCSGALRGLIERPAWPIEVTVACQRKGHPGIRCFTASDLTAEDRTIVDGIPCTSVARTLLGIAVQAPANLEEAIAAAEKRCLLDLTAIDALIARCPRRPGVPALRRALREHRVEYEWTRSRLERCFIALCERAGLGRPSVNSYLSVPGWAGEVDFQWPELWLIVETDGWDAHNDRAAFEADRRRDQHLIAAGWRVIRLTWRQVVYEPERVVGMLQALAASSPR